MRGWTMSAKRRAAAVRAAIVAFGSGAALAVAVTEAASQAPAQATTVGVAAAPSARELLAAGRVLEIGRASWRERV